MKKTVAVLLAFLMTLSGFVVPAHSSRQNSQAFVGEVSEPEETTEANSYYPSDKEGAYLLSHFYGDFDAYHTFLREYYSATYESIADAPDAFLYFMDTEMCRARNRLPHPYLSWFLSEETGEATVLGLRAVRYEEFDDGVSREFYNDYTNVNADFFIIPDEIDGHPVTKIQAYAFPWTGQYLTSYLHTVVIGRNVREIGKGAFMQDDLDAVIILSREVTIDRVSHFNRIYCYANTLAETSVKEKDRPYFLIDGDSLVWDGEAVEGNALTNCVGMTEAELRTHLSIDGTSSEIQIDGLQNGKVVNGTTVTLFHTIAQAPGKVYTVGEMPVPVSATIETLPTKTNYIYKEAFDPTSLSLRITYDNGDETVVTDNITCTGTDLTLGTNTITATYENVSATFTVTVRAPQPVSATVETLPTKTNYIYKEAFDPTGLSLRITYDNGDETVVTDNITCMGTDLTVGTNTITATYENVSATFTVTVRYTWWQYLIRFLLFGFLWY